MAAGNTLHALSSSIHCRPGVTITLASRAAPVASSAAVSPSLRPLHSSAFLQRTRLPGSCSSTSSLTPGSRLFSNRACGTVGPRLFGLPPSSTETKGGSVVSVRAATMESRQMPVAFRAPDFELPEPLTGKVWTLEDFEDQQGLLVMFICNHCPFVVHLKESLTKFAKVYQQKGLGVVAISSNSVASHPQDGPKYMAEDAKKFGYPFPYLYDETQEVAKAYGAVCTPDFFLFKKDGRKPFELAYHGRFDETRPRSQSPITGRDLQAAVDAILSAQPVTADQKPSIGCSIKWHPGK